MFGFLAPFLLEGLTWATMGAWTQNLPQMLIHVLGPGHHLQLYFVWFSQEVEHKSGRSRCRRTQR